MLLTHWAGRRIPRALAQTPGKVRYIIDLGGTCKATVNAPRLAKLPDHGIVINAARGEIIDQDALFAELKSGRLRAGLDVLVGDNYLPAGHEAHT